MNKQSIIDNVLDNALKKYSDYRSLINKNELLDFLKNEYDNYNQSSNINISIYLAMEAESFILKQLCLLAKNDIDILLHVINKYNFIPILLNRRLHLYDDNELTSIIENGFMEIVEEYDGNLSFTEYVTKYFQKKFNIYKEPVKKIKN